jgi:hypothetical protein
MNFWHEVLLAWHSALSWLGSRVERGEWAHLANSQRCRTQQAADHKHNGIKYGDSNGN